MDIHIRCLEYRGKQTQVPSAVEKQLLMRKNIVHSHLDGLLFSQGIIPGGIHLLFGTPFPSGKALDGLYRYISLLAQTKQSLDILLVGGLLKHRKVVREEHRIKIIDTEAIHMSFGSIDSMAGNPCEANQALLFCFLYCLKSTPLTHRSLPFRRIDKKVQLP
ncbi:hypothetical protein SDC9_191716 [bioreactor metagenome]|uniref:Uncharacterized protein n=1 Tax=bioreactor metagenome TaxID=1076179 RepID=A0A645HYN2_9ZZZZ